jgi:hypothetical protein
MVRGLLLAIEARNDLTPRVFSLDGRDVVAVGHHISRCCSAKAWSTGSSPGAG